MNTTKKLTDADLAQWRAERLAKKTGSKLQIQPVEAFSAQTKGVDTSDAENVFGGVPGLTAEEESWLDPEFVRLLAQVNAAGFKAGFDAGVAAATKGGVR